MKPFEAISVTEYREEVVSEKAEPEVTPEEVLRKVEIYNELLDYFLEKINDDKLDAYIQENDSQKDDKGKFYLLEKAYKDQEEELIMTRKELDFANQEIFNMRMKYGFLEKSL
jgi:hypothetical protein